jgi:nicotinate (nicotinamide) nucleotide adenylyltransferase
MEARLMGDILVFGLSSDPIHAGHVELVTSGVVQLLGRGYHVSEVILVPTGFPHPAKQASATSFAHRLAMCRLGSEEIARELSGRVIRVRCTAIEHLMQEVRPAPGPSYTIETLHVLVESLSLWRGWAAARDTRFILLMASDLFEGATPPFASWAGLDEILAHATLAICPRPCHTPSMPFIESLSQKGGDIALLDPVFATGSSSQIRRRLMAGEDVMALASSGLVPFAVAEFILQHGLYGVDSVGSPIREGAAPVRCGVVEPEAH